jgi:hypothetical protein
MNGIKITRQTRIKCYHGIYRNRPQKDVRLSPLFSILAYTYFWIHLKITYQHRADKIIQYFRNALFYYQFFLLVFVPEHLHIFDKFSCFNRDYFLKFYLLLFLGLNCHFNWLLSNTFWMCIDFNFSSESYFVFPYFYGWQKYKLLYDRI